MASVKTFHFFLALVVLITVALILILLYFLLRSLNKHDDRIDSEIDLEEGRQTQLQTNTSSQKRIQQQHEVLQQRISIAPPRIELLPDIKASEERTEGWLERGKEVATTNEGSNIRFT